MSEPEPLTTYLELRESAADGSEGAGLSHSAEGLFLLHVQEIAAAGEPRGTLTIVHGAGDHGGRYVAVGRAAALDHWAVALPDMRGHGRSEGDRGHSAGLKEVVRDLDAVQDHLAYRLPDAPKFVVGIGLGALYALVYALERPGRLAGLVLVSPLWEPRFEPPAPPTGLKKLFKKIGPTTPGRIGFEPERAFADAQQAVAWRTDALCHDVITSRACEEARRAASEYVPRLAEAGVPVLVLQGSADPSSAADRGRALAGPGVSVEVFEGAGHDLFHEPQKDEVVERLRTWLAAR